MKLTLVHAALAQSAAIYHLGSNPSTSAPRLTLNGAQAYFSEALGVEMNNLFWGKESSKIIDLIDGIEPRTKPAMVVSVSGVQNADIFGQPDLVTDDGELLDLLQWHMEQQEYSAAKLTPGITAMSQNNIQAFSREFEAVDEAMDRLWERTKSTLGLEKSRITDKFFVTELTALQMAQEYPYSAEDVLLVDLYALQSIAKSIGTHSNTFEFAQQVLSDYLRGLQHKFDVYVLVPKNHAQEKMSKRSEQLPTTFKTSCYSSEEACQKGTDNCSSHGVCSKVSGCWACLCSATVNKTTSSTTRWAGADCSKRDVSVPAHLFLWTTLSLVVLVGGGIQLMYGVGSEELSGILEK